MYCGWGQTEILMKISSKILMEGDIFRILGIDGGEYGNGS
jgi:hypothetical protein